MKYEEVYLKDYADRRGGDHGLGNYFEFTNTERPRSNASSKAAGRELMELHDSSG